MKKRNQIYIATSIDGYIAEKNGGLDWLQATPNPEGSDLGYSKFTDQIDALVMGRNTFEMICGFEGDWPYKVPVFVLSNSLNQVKEEYQDKAFLVNGTLQEVVSKIHNNGFYSLYIDGGKTVQGFLKEDLVDDLIITTIPIVLGEGVPLFSPMETRLEFDLVSSEVFINQLVQTHYKRKK